MNTLRITRILYDAAMYALCRATISFLSHDIGVYVEAIGVDVQFSLCLHREHVNNKPKMSSKQDWRTEERRAERRWLKYKALALHRLEDYDVLQAYFTIDGYEQAVEKHTQKCLTCQHFQELQDKLDEKYQQKQQC